MKKLKNTDLKEALANAEAELAALHKRAESLREWIIVTKKLCAKNSKVSGTIDAEAIVTRRTRTPALAQQVHDLLVEVGSSMHVDDIVEALKTKGQPVMAQNPKATVAVALSRRPDQFTRVKPNTFALVADPGGTKDIGIAS